MAKKQILDLPSPWMKGFASCTPFEHRIWDVHEADPRLEQKRRTRISSESVKPAFQISNTLTNDVITICGLPFPKCVYDNSQMPTTACVRGTGTARVRRTRVLRIQKEEWRKEESGHARWENGGESLRKGQTMNFGHSWKWDTRKRESRSQWSTRRLMLPALLIKSACNDKYGRECKKTRRTWLTRLQHQQMSHQILQGC